MNLKYLFFLSGGQSVLAASNGHWRNYSWRHVKNSSFKRDGTERTVGLWNRRWWRSWLRPAVCWATTSDPPCTSPGVPTGPTQPEQEGTGILTTSKNELSFYFFPPQKPANVRQSASHLTAAEVLQEVGKALDDAGVLRTVSIGVTDEDFGAGPRPLRI